MTGGDDKSLLFLSTDDSPANKVPIAEMPFWTSPRQYLGWCNDCPVASNISEPIPLVAGRKYFVESLMQEAQGRDHVSVAWKKPGDPAPRSNSDLFPIPALYLSTTIPSGPVTIIDQPQDQTVDELSAAAFRVGVVGTPPYTYQWHRHGAELEAATGTDLIIPAVALAQEGEEYEVVIRNHFSSVTSRVARLRVIADVTPPALAGAVGSPTVREVTIRFSEAVSPTLATNLLNYAIDGGLEVLAARMVGDRAVRLTTNPQEAGARYTITVSGIEDVSAAGNVIAPDSPVKFSAWATSRGAVLWEAYTNVLGDSVEALTASPRFPDIPDVVRVLPAMNMGEEGEYFGNYYGVRMSAWFVPSVSGNWVFYIRSDETAQLFVSNDESEKNLPAQPQAEATRCCIGFAPPGSEQTTDPIPMVGGNRYFVRALFQEALHADWFQLAAALEEEPVPEAPAPSSFWEFRVNPDGAGLAISRLGNEIVLWLQGGGLLQHGPGVEGPWEELPLISDRLVITPSESEQYYRRVD